MKSSNLFLKPPKIEYGKIIKPIFTTAWKITVSQMNNVRLICFHFMKKEKSFLFNVEKYLLKVYYYGWNSFLDIWVFNGGGGVQHIRWE